MLMSSEAPLPQAWSRGWASIGVKLKCKALPFSLFRKNTMGITAPTVWLRPVARAAPARPQRNTPTSSASSTILVTPALTVAASPSRGFSAAIRKLWNTFWNIKATLKAMTIRP